MYERGCMISTFYMIHNCFDSKCVHIPDLEPVIRTGGCVHAWSMQAALSARLLRQCAWRIPEQRALACHLSCLGCWDGSEPFFLRHDDKPIVIFMTLYGGRLGK